MDNQLLNVRLLDTATGTMARNRTLLFTVNLIAALLLTVVYLERASFDTKQREGNLIVYKDRCVEINNALNTSDYWKGLPADQRNKFAACSKPDEIREFIITNDNLNLSKEQLQLISSDIYRLHRIQNELDQVLLDKATATPLGFGLPIPRNDLVLLCGALLVILYLWLAFSFNQHARIITKIKLLFPENKKENYNGNQATINDLVELNFLFHTDKWGITTILVFFLYLLAPLAMTVATANDYFFLDITPNYEDYLKNLHDASSYIKITTTIFLWLIGFYILRSDRITNKEPKDLIVLCGLKIGMKKSRVSKILHIDDLKDEIKLDYQQCTLKGAQDAQSISLSFSREKLSSIEITYSDKIHWKDSKEFAARLSKIFNLPFDSWNISSASNQGDIEFDDLALKIDSNTNQVILTDKAVSEEENKKNNFRV